jgi:hypothetical protein
VVDLLAVIAYTQLKAVSRLASDAELAPSLEERVALVDLAVAEHEYFCRLVARIEGLGAVPQEAMAPFVAPVDAFHDRTRPQDWYERLVKAYVGDAIGTDFYREVAGYVDPETRTLVEAVATDTSRAEVVARSVRTAVAGDPRLAGRLSLWARRLVGEALSQAHRVVVDRPRLGELVALDADASAEDLGELSRLLGRLTERHVERMKVLGLSA